MTVINPERWFETLHSNLNPDALHLAFLYRSAAHWLAFNLVQIMALVKWQQKHYWLAVTAGVRFSDILTDFTYWLTAPSLSSQSWFLLIPTILNIGMAVFLLNYYVYLENQKKSNLP